MANFEVEKDPQRVTFKCSADLTDEEGNELLKELGTLMGQLGKDTPVVIDLNVVHYLGADFLRNVAAPAKTLKQLTSKPLYIVNAPKSVHRDVSDKGLDSLIRCLSTLEAAQVLKAITPAPQIKAPPKLDVGFLNPFIDGTLTTLKVQCSIEAKAQKLFAKGTAPTPPAGIAGVIGISSEAFCGSIAICFPAPTFLAVMGSLLGETYTEITTEVQDGAGELLNIIFGLAKKSLNEKGYGIEKAIPTIVQGQALQVRQLTKAAAIIVPFESTAGAFHIEIGLEGSSL